MGGVESLFRKLQPLVVRREVEDILSWKESKNYNFLVRSLYRSYMRASRDPFPWSIIWRSWVLVRVSFFAWEVPWNKIMTIDQLKRRGWKYTLRALLLVSPLFHIRLFFTYIYKKNFLNNDYKRSCCLNLNTWVPKGTFCS